MNKINSSKVKKILQIIAVCFVILISLIVLFNITYSSKNSYRIMENVPVDESGTSWRQPIGYGAYKIWVSNTTDSDVQAIITSSWGYENTDTIPAGFKTVIINNKAHPVMYNLNFITEAGKLDGEISLRVYQAYPDEEVKEKQK